MSSDDAKHLAARITLMEAQMRSVSALLTTIEKIVSDTRTELIVLHARVSAAVAE